jgi:hypothetical protein
VAGITEGENLALFGLPLSDVQTQQLEGKDYQVQWFERARFELHPENQPPYNVLLGLLGNEIRTNAAPPQTIVAPLPQPTVAPTPEPQPAPNPAPPAPEPTRAPASNDCDPAYPGVCIPPRRRIWTAAISRIATSGCSHPTRTGSIVIKMGLGVRLRARTQGG